MKNILISVLCGIAALAAVSCTKAGEPQFGHDQWESVLYLNESGQVSVDFYNAGVDVEYTSSVRKGGTDPAVERTARLRLYTEEEMASYNDIWGTDYTILPEGYYTMPEEFVFGADDQAIDYTITFDASIGSLDRSRTYALPIVLESDGYSVNEDKQLLMLGLDVITPEVGLSVTGKQPAISLHTVNPTFQTASFTVGLDLNMENMGWDFTAHIETDEADLGQLVSEYSEVSGTSYTLLPAGAYSMEESIGFTGNESSRETVLDINVSEAGLSEGEYLLPIVVESIEGMPFEADDTPCYVHVSMTAGMIEIDIDASAISGNQRQDEYSRMVDGVLGEFGSWQSLWNSYQVEPEELCDPTYGVYVDFRLPENAVTSKIGLYMHVWGTNNFPKDMDFYVRRAGSSEWTKVGSSTNTFPDVNTKEWTSEPMDTGGTITDFRIAFLTSSAGDLRTVHRYSGDPSGWMYYTPNVGCDEIVLSGY